MHKSSLFIILLFLVVGLIAPAAFAADKKGVDQDDVVFIPMDPLFLPIFDPDTGNKTFTLMFSLEIHDVDDATVVHSNVPRLSDAYIGLLYGSLQERGLVRTGGFVDMPRVKEELALVSNEVLGSDIVKDVLIQKVSIHSH